MVHREHELRLSSEWQKRFEAAERREDTDWLDCVEELQREICREMGVPESTVHKLRCANQLFPEEALFRELPIYVRFNRARNGPLSPGLEAPNVRVLLDGERRELYDFGGDVCPLVLLAGSHS